MRLPTSARPLPWPIRQALVALLLAVFAVSPARPAIADGELDVSIQSIDDAAPLTSVVLTVLGPDRRPLIGLRPEQIQVQDNGVAGRVVGIERAVDANVGIGVVLAIQTSSSMASTLPNVRQAARALINSLSPNDQAAIVSFANEVRVEQPMTADRQALGAALDRLVAAGNPAVYDAVISSVDEASRASPPRKLVILLTDAGGVGRISRATREEAIDRAAASGVSVNSLGFGTVVDLQFLSELGQRTQGRVLSAPTIADVTSAYAELAEVLRSQYILRLEPTAAVEPRQHELTVRVTAAPGSGSATRSYETKRQAPAPAPTEQPQSAPAAAPAPVSDSSGGNSTLMWLLAAFAVVALGSGGFVYQRRRTRVATAGADTAPDQRPIPPPDTLPARPRRVAAITVVDGPELGQSAEVREGVVTIGSAPTASLQLADLTVPPERLRLFWRDDQLMLHDLTAAGAAHLGEWQTVRDGDELDVGRYHLRVTIREAGAQPEAESEPDLDSDEVDESRLPSRS
jgi:VWFA-related protein